MHISIERIGQFPIYHVTIKSRHRLGMTFLRMQEYYESPKFKGEVFTIDEFIAWFKRKEGSFSYTRLYQAYNVPGAAVQVVYKRFRPHTSDEQLLFGELAQKTDLLTNAKSYLIGTTGTNQLTFRHELAHALFFTSPEYQAKALEVIKKYKLEEMIDFLERRHYHRSVFKDELQAYAMSTWPNAVSRTREMRAFRKELQLALSPFFDSL